MDSQRNLERERNTRKSFFICEDGSRQGDSNGGIILVMIGDSLTMVIVRIMMMVVVIMVLIIMVKITIVMIMVMIYY